MDPYTLAYLAGHSDFSTTKRYVHTQAETVRAAMERVAGARGGHSFGHSKEKAAETSSALAAVSGNDFSGINDRGEWIRTTDLLVPNHPAAKNQTLSGIAPGCSPLRTSAKESNSYGPPRAILAQPRAAERCTGWAQKWSQRSGPLLGV